MAVTTQESTQYANIFTTTPAVNNETSDWKGRVRCMYFVHDQSGAGDATSSVALCKLPAGRVRLLLPSSWLYVNWTTASATLDLGWDAYTDLDGAAVTADPNGLADGIDVESAGFVDGGTLAALAGLAATGGTKVFESKDGVVIRATSEDTAIADGDDIAGYLLYVHD